MAIKPTKQRIINAAITLYNVQGVNNTTLKHIADSVGMSVGNLAYHFSNHEYIIEEIYRQLDVERQQMFQNMQNSPSFENIYRRIGHTLWMIMTSWCVQHVLRKQDMDDIDFEEAQQTAWSLLMPHLTPKGLYLLQELTATADKL